MAPVELSYGPRAYELLWISCASLFERSLLDQL
jgi:hypothetical protein